MANTSSQEKPGIGQAAWLRYSCWFLLVISPIISILIIGGVTGSSLASLDGWSTTWNDEQRYYRTVQQMRELGEPGGVAGYNEVPSERPSYGPYSVFVYSLHYLGSFVTGYQSHNFIYLINMALGVLTCLVIVLVLRPSVRQSLIFAVLFLFHFIIARYFCSGMTEAGYVLFASLMSCCAFYAADRAGGDLRPGLGVAAFVVLELAIGFWGLMRPYLLAFMLVPFMLLVFGGMKMRKGARVALAVSSVAVAVLSLAVYMYLSKYYSTPYFYSPTIANDFFNRVASALPTMVDKHVTCVLYACAKLVKLDWRGIMIFTFALCWVVLLAMSVRAMRSGRRTQGVLLLAFVIAGFAIFEAHMMMYTHRQMHRTMMAVDVAYLLAIIWYGDIRFRTSKVTLRATVIAAVCVLCVASLAVRPGEFRLPQVAKSYNAEAEATEQEQLRAAIPYDEDRWDVTIAHPVENSKITIYFNVPVYVGLNAMQPGYLEKCVQSDSFNSKYVSLPDNHDLVDEMKKRYEVIYEGDSHVIFRVRE